MALGTLERSVMNLLWDHQEALTATEVREVLASSAAGEDARALAVTTVLTVLSRLEKKKLVRRHPGRRPHRYSPLASREEHTAAVLHELLGTVPDRQAVLARFIGGISPQEAAAVRDLLNRAAD